MNNDEQIITSWAGCISRWLTSRIWGTFVRMMRVATIGGGVSINISIRTDCCRSLLGRQNASQTRWLLRNACIGFFLVLIVFWGTGVSYHRHYERTRQETRPDGGRFKIHGMWVNEIYEMNQRRIGEVWYLLHSTMLASLHWLHLGPVH